MICIFALQTVNASVEWTVKKLMQFDKTPLDFSPSSDGKMVYILVQGKILFYSIADNTVVDFMTVDTAFDRLAFSDKDNSFILTSSKEKLLKIFQMDIRQKLDITGLPFKGPEKAQVIVAVFSDYQCPYCSKLDHLLQQVVEKYPKEVKLVPKNFPLSFHSFSKTAATAALAAHEQGKYWGFHKKLFENISSLNDAKVQEIAKELNLDLEKFNKKMQDPSIQELINRDLAEGQRIGVTGTPTIFINGKPLKDRSLQGFQQMIDAELKK
jgi:protein-disulfide isomerase